MVQAVSCLKDCEGAPLWISQQISPKARYKLRRMSGFFGVACGKVFAMIETCHDMHATWPMQHFWCAKLYIYNSPWIPCLLRSANCVLSTASTCTRHVPVEDFCSRKFGRPIFLTNSWAVWATSGNLIWQCAHFSTASTSFFCLEGCLLGTVALELLPWAIAHCFVWLRLKPFLCGSCHVSGFHLSPQTLGL